MDTNELKQKLMGLADNLLTYSFMVRGENRRILDALRIYLSADMSDTELAKVLSHLSHSVEADAPLTTRKDVEAAINERCDKHPRLARRLRNRLDIFEAAGSIDWGTVLRFILSLLLFLLPLLSPEPKGDDDGE